MASGREHVVFSTELGDIKILLRKDVAPKTCELIKKLTEQGLYNGCCFYRAESNFVVQGGLTKASGGKVKNPYGNVPLEYSLKNKKGTVTLARWEDTNSGGSEFFINLKDNTHLDRSGDSGWALGFAVWGQVVAGMDVASKIEEMETTKKNGLKMLVKPVAFNAKIVTE